MPYFTFISSSASMFFGTIMRDIFPTVSLPSMAMAFSRASASAICCKLSRSVPPWFIYSPPALAAFASSLKLRVSASMLSWAFILLPLVRAPFIPLIFPLALNCDWPLLRAILSTVSSLRLNDTAISSALLLSGKAGVDTLIARALRLPWDSHLLRMLTIPLSARRKL